MICLTVQVALPNVQRQKQIPLKARTEKSVHFSNSHKGLTSQSHKTQETSNHRSQLYLSAHIPLHVDENQNVRQ
jgi:hypothetical protein